MGQTRKERKLRSSSFTAFWIVWMIKVKAHTGLRLAWFWGAPTSQNLPRIPTPHSQVTECTCPSSAALASDKSRLFSFSAASRSGFLLGPVNLLLGGGSSCQAHKTDPFTEGRQTDWRPVTVTWENLHKIPLPFICFWGTTTGDSGSQGLERHKSRRQAVLDTAYKRKALVRFLSLMAAYAV